jgi:hypothetical protein
MHRFLTQVDLNKDRVSRSDISRRDGISRNATTRVRSMTCQVGRADAVGVHVVLAVEQGEGWRNHTLQKRPFGSNAGQDANPNQNTQEMSSNLFRGHVMRKRTGRLTRLNTIEKELLQAGEDAGSDPLKFRIVRRHLQCRVYEQAAFVLAIVQRAAQDFGEKGFNRLAGRQRCAALHAPGDTALYIAIKSRSEESSLIAVGVIEAGGSNSRLIDEVFD